MLRWSPRLHRYLILNIFFCFVSIQLFYPLLNLQKSTLIINVMLQSLFMKIQIKINLWLWRLLDVVQLLTLFACWNCWTEKILSRLVITQRNKNGVTILYSPYVVYHDGMIVTNAPLKHFLHVFASLIYLFTCKRNLNQHTVGKKSIRALEIFRVQKLILNATSWNESLASHDL